MLADAALHKRVDVALQGDEKLQGRTTLDEWHENSFPDQIPVSARLYVCASDPTTTKGKEKEQYIMVSKDCCQDRPSLFIPFSCNGLRLFLPSGLGSVCNLGLLFFGPIAHHCGGVIVVFGTASVLIELLFGFFIVFITFTFGLFFGVLLGGGSLCFLRGRRLV
ncbi:hypothetical protein FJTKL_13286 [Diaporthe vaccinii]|uniref:Transmembrane protein n=1 Tax=Diaporthe vaccinii TaxID=105482 RepID=A0ABR4EB30_9PEZI